MASLKDKVPMLIDYALGQSGQLAHNGDLFQIYEGYLLEHVLADLRKQLSAQSFEQIQHRVAPVNVLRRLIDKLSKIYARPPARWLELPSDKDSELLDWYVRSFDADTNMGLANEFFNLFKNTLVEPYVRSDRRPGLRIVPSDRYTVYSEDRVDPTRPTHVIKYMGTITRDVRVGKKIESSTRKVFYVYSAEEFLAVDDEGEVLMDLMIQANNPDGINPYGRLPFVYVNRSRHSLIPPVDTDTLRMTKIFPILLSDLNFSVMFQAFSIVYGIDVDDENIQMSPNAFWRFKSDPASKSQPQVGVIKPQVDIAQVIGFIMAQLSFWLQSRNIRPGQVGQVSTESFASGVSKLVDEMDTYEDRQKQVPYFRDAERELWDLVVNAMHPVWVRDGAIDEKRLFDPGQRVHVEFPEQMPLARRIDTLAEVEKELALQLVTRVDALMRLNPEMSEAAAEEYVAAIAVENTIGVPAEEEAAPAAKHVHAIPGGGDTGVDVTDSAGGHYHSVSGGRTSADAYGDGHTHMLPDGREAGVPKPVEAKE